MCPHPACAGWGSWWLKAVPHVGMLLGTSKDGVEGPWLPSQRFPWHKVGQTGPVGKGLCNSGHWVLPQPVEATDDAFWDQFWANTATSVQDVFALVPAAEIRAVREESPSNLATLCYKVRGAQLLKATPS